MPFAIDKRECIGCGSCFNLCPYDAIAEVKHRDGELYRIDDKACMECSLCFNCCPLKAIKFVEQTCEGGETND